MVNGGCPPVGRQEGGVQVNGAPGRYAEDRIRQYPECYYDIDIRRQITQVLMKQRSIKLVRLEYGEAQLQGRFLNGRGAYFASTAGWFIGTGNNSDDLWIVCRLGQRCTPPWISPVKWAWPGRQNS